MKRLLLILCLILVPVSAQAKLILADTDDTLQVITASGVTTMFMYASWADITTTALTPGASDAQVTTATTTTLVAAPGASTQRQVKGFTIRNSHASSSNAVTVQFYDGATATELLNYTLLAGETLQWSEGEGFRIIDANGSVKGGAVIAEDTAHATGEALTKLGCRRIDSAATSAGTSGDWATVDCDANGALRVETELPAAAALADNTANPTVPGVAAFLMCYDGSTWDRCQGGLTDTDDNSIAFSQVPGLVVNIPYVSNGTTWERQRKFVYLEDDAHANQDTGAVVLSRRIDTLASSAGTSGDYATVNQSAEGATWITPSATTNGGCTVHSLLSAATVNETEVKATAGQVYWIQATNVNAAVAYLKFYNDTAANVDETDTPVLRLAIPGSTTGGGFTTNFPVGAVFSTAIVYRITTAVADNSTAAVAANEVLVNVCYK